MWPTRSGGCGRSSGRLAWTHSEGTTNDRSRNFVAAHKHSIRHQQRLEASERCGCFYCLAVFQPGAIERWLNEGDGTALCPACGMNSVLGSARATRSRGISSNG